MYRGFVIFILFFVLMMLLTFSGFKVFSIVMIIPFFIFFFIMVFALKFITGASKQSTTVKSCPTCHSHVPLYAKFCQYCGTKLSGKIICEYCGHENEEEFLQCEQCNGLLK
jgi:choline-glycine betaine transporter